MSKGLQDNPWQGRVDNPNNSETRRWHQSVLVGDINDAPKADFALAGYAIDEGVKRNKGRIGAAEGPNAIRKALSSFAWHSKHTLLDIGDSYCHGSKLEAAQAEYASKIAGCLNKGVKTIGLGGGHDIAFSHYTGVRAAFPDKKIGIINLDAHFDLRTPEPLTSSGTPFYQIAQQEEQLHYLCIGIQEYGNTQKLFNTAQQLHVKHFLRSQLRENLAAVLTTVEVFSKTVDVVYLTVDLDGFDRTVAPGVSAPTTDGLLIHEVLPIIHQLATSKKLKACDFAELNPSYDQDAATARLAAYLIFDLLKYWI